MVNSFIYFSNLKESLVNEASSYLCFAWRRYKVKCNVEMRKIERVEKERMKDIANKAKAASMRRKYQTSNYTSYAINGDSSIPVVPLNKIQNLDFSLKMTKGQSVFPTNQKRSSNSGFCPSLKNENSRFKKMETENSFSFNDTIVAKYLTYKNDNFIFKFFLYKVGLHFESQNYFIQTIFALHDFDKQVNPSDINFNYTISWMVKLVSFEIEVYFVNSRIEDDRYIKELEDELNNDYSPIKNSSSAHKMESIAEADSD